MGVLQLDSSGKGTLIPIAILFDGKFYDASAYKADPVPMALESGTVYEAEQSGVPDGLFTINGALHSKSANSTHAWMGTGTYLPPGAEAPKTTRKAEDVPVGLGSSGDDEPPRLTRSGSKPAGSSDSGSPAGTSKSGSGQKPAESAPGSGQPAGGSGAGSAGSGPASGSASGQDKPKSEKPPSSDKPVDAGAKQPAGGSQPGADKGSNGSSASAGTGGQSDGDYYRPQLRRGKPTAPAPPDVEDKVAARKTAANAEPVVGSKAAGAAHVRVVAAVSDAAGPDPQSYKFFWKTGEEEERRNQMLALAAIEVRAYAAALVRNQIPAQPAVPKVTAGGRNTQTKAHAKAQPVFENIQFWGFDLWLTSQPVMILSAEAHIPAAAGGATAAAASETYSVMLVARTDIYGDLRKLYSGVTDKFHLDVTPRLELIDTVDADGDGRGELLFRETTDAGNGYLIYRATADKLWKMFDSLNAE